MEVRRHFWFAGSYLFTVWKYVVGKNYETRSIPPFSFHPRTVPPHPAFWVLKNFIFQHIRMAPRRHFTFTDQYLSKPWKDKFEKNPESH